ncbi:hypothetical protein SAMN05216551_103177 [Chitinasiproducens palmae]|uniref:Uncharacterized protein n=1 Tax=Chitinasiproducens palmae TaxID=1770053 RepID=A0A1H2PM87_9BURK|nr:hypothetical protein SAMN05216551_103177 [Chitinasiproducens palmae]
MTNLDINLAIIRRAFMNTSAQFLASDAGGDSGEVVIPTVGVRQVHEALCAGAGALIC